MSDSDTDNDSKSETMKKTHRLQKFKNSWMELAEYKAWLRPVDNNKYRARCALCNAEFISELSTIKKHKNSAKHGTKSKAEQSVTPIDKYFHSASTSSSSSDMHEKNVKEAEIKLCGFLAEHNISFNTMDHLSPLLSKIFFDSKIAKDLSVRRTKSKSIVSNVIGMVHKSDIGTTLKTKKFSVLTDESTDIGVNKSACIVVRYFDEHQRRVESLLWELIPMFDEKEDMEKQGTAEHYFKKIVETFDARQIPRENIIGFASDGCNLMMGEFNSVASRFRNEFPGIFIMKCVCHSLHLCSSQACKTLPRALEDLARNIYSHFKVSSKRQCDFKQFQHFVELDAHKMLHPSQTRWLSLSAVVKRVVEQWPALQLYFNSKYLDERLLSVEQIHQSLNDPFVKLYYLFLNYVLPKISTLNQNFQSDKVVLPYLHKMMEEAYRSFLLCYMERRYITTTTISEIDPANKTWFLPKKNVYVGVDVLNEISKPIISGMPELLDMFFERCQLFYSCLCIEIRKRYDFDNFILPKLHIFMPKNAVSHNIHEQFPSLAHILQNMTRFFDSSESQLIDEQWRLLPDYHFTADEEKKIDINEDIEIFWGKIQIYQNESDIFEFQNLSKFVLNILSLPHSNAECERVFSKINMVKTKSRNKLITTTINGCLLTSQCVKKGGNCINFTPTHAMYCRMNKIDMYPSSSSQENEDEFIIDT